MTATTGLPAGIELISYPDDVRGLAVPLGIGVSIVMVPENRLGAAERRDVASFLRTAAENAAKVVSGKGDRREIGRDRSGTLIVSVMPDYAGRHIGIQVRGFRPGAGPLVSPRYFSARITIAEARELAATLEAR